MRVRQTEPHADASGFWAKLTFGFINGLLRQASKSADLGPRDAAYLLPPSDVALRLVLQFDTAYARATGGVHPSHPFHLRLPGSPWQTPLLLTLVRLHWRPLLWQQFLCMGEVAQALVTPVLLREFLRWLEAATQEDGQGLPPAWKGWVLAVALGLSGVSIPLMMHHHNWSGVRMALCMRQQAIAAIHAKILRMTASPGAAAASGDSGLSSGYISTLIGADVRRFDDALKQWPYLVASPLQLIAVIVMVGLELDFVSAVAGASISLALIPLQALLATYISDLRTARARCTDERVRLMSEAVEGHLAVKMCGLEDSFEARLRKLREAEACQVRRASRIRAFNLALYTSISSIIAFVTFSVHRARGGSLNVASVFYALSLLQLPAAYLVFDFVTAAQYATELGVSLTRIQAFLSLPEPPPPPQSHRLPVNLESLSMAAAAAGTPSAPQQHTQPSPCSPSTATAAVAAAPCAFPPRLLPPPAAAQSLPAAAAAGCVAMGGGDFDWRWPLGRPELEPSAEVLQLLAAAPDDDDEYGADALYGGLEVTVQAAPADPHGTAAEGKGGAATGGEAGWRGWCGACPPAGLRTSQAAPVSVEDAKPDTDAGASPLVKMEVAAASAQPVSATLSGVCFACAPGELLGVCGATGSGKSTLLAALLGQLQPLQPLREKEQLQPLQQQRGDTCGGGVEVCGSVAYCAQVPWIMAGSSVRENITFGLPYEEEWYDTVVRACCLHEDLARMAAGDLTELGEGGAGLSGGQKARVALARACYCRPHVALLDDPLSAVDARVGRELFDGVLGPAGLMASRCGTTRLLVTHQEQFLPLCDRVLLLRSGRQAALGPWAEVEQLRREAAPAGSPDTAEPVNGTPAALKIAAAAERRVDGEHGAGHASPVLERQRAGAEMSAGAMAPPLTVMAVDGCAGESGTTFTTCGGRSNPASSLVTALSRPTSGVHTAEGIPPVSLLPHQRGASPQRPPTGGIGAAPQLSRLRAVATVASSDGESPAAAVSRNGSVSGGVKSIGAGIAVAPAAADVFAPPRHMMTAGSGTASWASRRRRLSGGNVVDSLSAPSSPQWHQKLLMSIRLQGLADRTHGMARDNGGEQLGSMGRARTAFAQWIGTSMRLTMGRGGAGGGRTSDPDNSVAAGESLKRAPTGVSLLAAEDKATGSVPWAVYGRYVRCLGLVLACVVVLGLLAGEAAYLAADWWLALWAAEEPEQQAEPRWQVVYSILTGVVVLLAIARFVLFFEASISASTELHNKMLRRVLRAPLSFFHSNPAGRIINRFSKDQGLVDDLLPAALGEVLDSGMLVVGALVLVAVAVPFVLPLFLPLAVMFLFVRRRYVTASREVRRWEAVTYSPIYTFVAATCKGLPTIRAYGAGERFQRELLRLLSHSAEWSFASNAGASWISLRLDTISAVTLLLAALMAVLVRGRINVEVLALALTHSLSLTHMMQFFVQQSAEVENHMTSVERLLAYTQLDSEPPRVAEGGGQPPQGWPSSGHLQFEDVSAAYQPGLPPVLRGVTFSVSAGSSCGVVGRTGSGKSSLLLTLFRMVDLTHGCIRLDGVDIAAVGLDALRRHLAVIPQDPVLFGGSLRSNLDPWGAHSRDDAALWAVLRCVRLAGAVSALPGGLDAQVAAGGANLSAGQRQLLCLARAMLQRAKVLALDEATANVDAETDEAVQAALRDFLQGGGGGGPDISTTGGSGAGGGSGGGGVALVIAHRLDTVMDLDALLVLADGQVEEWGPPRVLLRGGGSLSHMAAAAAVPQIGSMRSGGADAVVDEGQAGDLAGTDCRVGLGKMVRSVSDAGWRG